MVELNYIEIGKRIRLRRKEVGLTQRELGKLVNLSEGSVSKYESGKVEEATTTRLNDFAVALNVDIAWLLSAAQQDDRPSHPYSLTPKEERDIARDLERTLASFESNESLTFDGEPLDDETKELMRISLENSMRLAKQLAKKKFTPKKYK